MVSWMSGCATEMRHKQCLLKVGTLKVFTVEKFKIYVSKCFWSTKLDVYSLAYLEKIDKCKVEMLIGDYACKILVI